MLIYTQSLVWPATRPHYSLNFGWKKKSTYDYTRLYIHNNEKNVTKVALFVLLNQNNVVAREELKKAQSKDSER